MRKGLQLLATLQLFAASLAAAQDLVRDAAALEQLEIQGVSLSMTAEQAFDKLRSTGFRAGDLDTYAEWDTDSIEFVRGTYGSPEGHSSVAMTRKGDRLVMIGETYNAPGNPIDAEAAISAVKRQLAIPADSIRCKATSATSGACQIQDAELPEDVNIRHSLQIISTMRIATLTRTKELR